jgi:hypothetical protein
MVVCFKGAHVPVEELMWERGVPVNHAAVTRRVIKYSPPLEEAFHRQKRPVWSSWRLDETYRYYLDSVLPGPAPGADAAHSGPRSGSSQHTHAGRAPGRVARRPGDPRSSVPGEGLDRVRGDCGRGPCGACAPATSPGMALPCTAVISSRNSWRMAPPTGSIGNACQPTPRHCILGRAAGRNPKASNSAMSVASIPRTCVANCGMPSNGCDEHTHSQRLSPRCGSCDLHARVSNRRGPCTEFGVGRSWLPSSSLCWDWYGAGGD